MLYLWLMSTGGPGLHQHETVSKSWGYGLHWNRGAVLGVCLSSQRLLTLVLPIELHTISQQIYEQRKNWYKLSLFVIYLLSTPMICDARLYIITSHWIYGMFYVFMISMKFGELKWCISFFFCRNPCAMLLPLNYLRLWFCRSMVYKSTLYMNSWW